MILPSADLLDQVSWFTMLTPARLTALYVAAERVMRDEIPGALVECGCLNGGSGAILARASRVHGPRKLWLFDSFQGLPTAGPEDLRELGADGRSADMLSGSLVGSVAMVWAALSAVEADLEQVEVVPGWFEDTLPKSKTGAIALLHLDADFYASTMTALRSLYKRVSKGGIVVVDDYGAWPGCRMAVHDYFKAHPPRPELFFTHETTSEPTAVEFTRP